jgi:hypothetical protein
MQPAMIELPPPTGKLIGALQVLRANTDHHDSAAGQAAIDKALAAVRSYGEACARAALEAAAQACATEGASDWIRAKICDDCATRIRALMEQP